MRSHPDPRGIQALLVSLLIAHIKTSQSISMIRCRTCNSLYNTSCNRNMNPCSVKFSINPIQRHTNPLLHLAREERATFFTFRILLKIISLKYL